MTIRTTSFQTIIEDGVATMTLDRPERLNALTFEVYEELRRTFVALDDADDVRAIVLTGKGRGFCTGGDVEDIIGALFSRDAAGLLDFTRMTCDLIAAIRRCRKPVIAGLNGTVAGAGAVIALACDLRIANSTAKIAFLFTRVGLCGADMGAAWMLPRVIGHGLATQLLMTGEFVEPARAAAIGLYNEVVEPDELGGTISDWAKRLAAGPRMGLELTKRMLDLEASVDLTTALEMEAQTQALCMQNPDFREAHDAFVARRPPNFR